ncbi:helix-turn-helix domain-containing protein [Niallia circulans]
MLESNIKIRLAENRMKHQDLSKELNVTKQTLSNWVNGKSAPTLETAFKMAHVLNCKVDDLFTYIEDK